MRVVVPYTAIHPATAAALEELAPDAEMVDLSGDVFAYQALVERLWADGETFLLWEHDITPTATALAEALSCRCWWSASPYPGPNGVTLWRCFGFTRFRAEMLAATPNAARDAGLRDDSTDVPPRHWLRCDSRLIDVLLVEGYAGPHRHSAVGHHHDYGSG